MRSQEKGKLLPALAETTRGLEARFDRITPERKQLLDAFAAHVREKTAQSHALRLNFICTHNSRRSHMAQLWAQAASYYYNVRGIRCYSGGTEATAFNPRAVDAMRKLGFNIRKVSEGDNPVYEAMFSDDAPALKMFSKRYDDPFNPSTDFTAIMTCSQADENCPVVAGASKRISVTYDDPKDFDGTPQEEQKYFERALEIGTEMLYVLCEVTRR